MEDNASRRDYTDTYPKGFFDLFGSDPTYPDVPEDIPLTHNTDEFSRVDGLKIEDWTV